MIRYNRRANDKTDYDRLIRVLKNNQDLFNRISSRTGFKKEDIMGAAILHFSTLSPREQLEIVAKYPELK